jgi:hypothetical protein
VRAIYSDPRYAGKQFYPFVYGRPMYESESAAIFANAVMDNNGVITTEHYFQEKPTAEAATADFMRMRDEVLGWQKFRPDSNRHMLFAMGYMAAPPETLNIDPSVDFKVFLDMEMHFIANDPAFTGLYGIQHYLNSYADEETVRWAARLYRHYGIEGKKSLLSDRYGFRYKLEHITNPDFDEGTAGWTTAAAEDGGIRPGKMDGWSWLEGRWRRTTKGDNFLVMKRGGAGRSSVSQEIRNLEPGKLYSLKLISADYQDIAGGVSDKNVPELSIGLDDVKLVRSKCFDNPIESCYDHNLGSFNRDHRAWMTYHWRVFRAKGRTARLTISDGAPDGKPLGPAGQEIMFNFVEVQPYYSG